MHEHIYWFNNAVIIVFAASLFVELYPNLSVAMTMAYYK